MTKNTKYTTNIDNWLTHNSQHAKEGQKNEKAKEWIQNR
jgi:hypothetical protein